MKPKYAHFKGNRLIKRFDNHTQCKSSITEGLHMRRWVDAHGKFKGAWTKKFYPIRQEITYLYCENEMWSGYPCGTEGCPHCGGPDGVEETKKYVSSVMKNAF
ncbi:MAG TPA: hypothetical protein DDY27_00885 [Hyphomonadaceae bacterium]|nr:hypothetical protein [Hyphomonadaceae bacterium]